jgi:hypothetical protein
VEVVVRGRGVRRRVMARRVIQRKCWQRYYCCVEELRVENEWEPGRRAQMMTAWSWVRIGGRKSFESIREE